VLYQGARSETLGAMLSTLHARIRLWRSLGLKHPNRSSRRSRESEQSLKSLISAVKKRDADEAEKIMLEEVHKAAAEVIRLLADGYPKGGEEQRRSRR
jgi:DNA-binding GntR family transcriptional regulator